MPHKIKKLSFETPLEDIVRYFDTIINSLDYSSHIIDQENHVVMPIYIYLLAKRFNVRVESHSLRGRCDLRIDFANNKTLIFEIKYHRPNDKISVKTYLENALQQIKDKRYLDIPDREVKGYALVFDKDTCRFEAFAEI